MKFSETWLREWINPPITNIELVNQLTMAGFQVEASQPVFKSFFHGIIIGEIIKCKAHPDLNKTWIITINIGHKKQINIVCNNINYQKNHRIVVACAGALLPTGNVVSSIIIKGEKSEGILCTYSMFKLSDHINDIIILPPDAPIGCNFHDYLSFHDKIIDINIPYNRGDCLNIVGLAREIAAINRLKLKKIKISTIKSCIIDTVPIIIEDFNQCPKFLGRIIKNINTSVATPLNIKQKLFRCGICSVNAVIDITNYVLLELGYPIHAFDYDTISQNTVYVRCSKNGETINVSDQPVHLKLFQNTLIIADGNKPLSIAGIIIGNQSTVSTNTHNIFLQSAFFHSSDILQQSRLYNLNTLSSTRYERGVDHNLAELALNYVTSLLLKICHGKPGPMISLVHRDHLPQSRIIILNRSRLDTILGFRIKKSEVTCILKYLGFQVKTQNNNIWTVLIPTWRSDITIEENLISEIIRIYGYNKIPQISVNTTFNKPNFQTDTISLLRTKTILVDRGYQEVITYSFVNNYIQKLLYPKHTALMLKKPINSSMSAMRLSLWPGLIQTVIYNQNRQHKHFRLFENGICFTLPSANGNQISQPLMLAGIRSGLRYHPFWNNAVTPLVDFYDIKGDVESILRSIINKNGYQIIFKKCIHTALHPGKSAVIYLNNILIGYIGMIHPIIQKQLNLQLNTFVFELSWDLMSQLKLPVKIMNISKFPKNYRDISMIVPDHMFFEDIMKACKNLNISQLTEIKLIDMYTGNNIPKGYKSFTIQLTVQSQQYTLKENEILKVIKACVHALEIHCRAILR